jgi:Fe(3+) dicitrate transport protein
MSFISKYQKFAAALLGLGVLLSYPIGYAQVNSDSIQGKVVDPSGASMSGSVIKLQLLSTGAEWITQSAQDGTFGFPGAVRGHFRLSVAAAGFTEHRQTVRAGEAGASSLEIKLQPMVLAQEMVVHGGAVVGPESALDAIPGSVSTLDSALLTQSRVLTIDEALRKATGVFTRAEEGMGLRPNIGIRGLNPTRSTKVLLLEDGMPVSYAPYGDNSSYYHPPVDRFDQIEVVKGSGQVLYGPQTIGGVVNYMTPAPPDRSSGFITLTGGNLNYFNGHARYGTTAGKTGLLFDFMRKQGEGARENTRFGMNDATAKVLHPLGEKQTLSLKMNYYGEDSNLTYSGLREAEWAANPWGNPFRNDFLDFKRVGGSATHTYALKPNAVLTTNFYGQSFERAWWRQTSNSNQRPNDASDPLCAGMANLNTTCGNEGRVRSYRTFGLDPNMRTWHSWGNVRSQMDFGFRGHFEHQDRVQMNGDTPVSRDGRLVENNLRTADAWSGYYQNRIQIGKFGISPGLRVENVSYLRTNRLLGVTGTTNLTQWIPGLGVSYSPTAGTTIFGGVHRGFSPPRAEDIINNTTGGTVELEPEMSWNYELGLRTRLDRRASLEATFFRMDFENQIVPASVAGGIGATLTSAGRTLHQGAEFAGRTDFRSVFGTRHSLWLRGAYTWIPVSEYAGQRFSSIGTFRNVLVTGNRLPYAPRNLLNAMLGYSHTSGLNAMIESVHTGRQFGDDLNSINPTPDGQRGAIPGNFVWNATVNYPVEQWRTTFFVAAKNIGDRLYIVDRTRGLLPGMPRLVQVGVRFSF